MVSRALSIAASGMNARTVEVDVISNNIANSTTTGYKRGQASFKDLAYQSYMRMGINGDQQDIPAGVQIGLGTAVAGVSKIFEQGALNTTPGVSTNIAINGPGFFQVTLPNGEVGYTRAGDFQVNSAGELVDHLGNIVTPGIVIPTEALYIEVSQSGLIEAIVKVDGGGTDRLEVARFELFDFINPSGLEAIGNNIYLATEASGEALAGEPNSEGFGTTIQYALESSNVSSVTEITNLVKAQRAYEMASKVLQVTDSMLKTLNDSKT